MTAVRFRANLRYTVGSGYAQWVSDQMAVRLTMAFHMRQGEPNEERSHVTTDIVSSGPQAGRKENVDLDVFWPAEREDLALDTRNTLEATIPFLRPDDGPERSWMDWHRCEHDVMLPCPAPEWVWPVPVVAGEWAPGVAYAVNDEVTYSGTLYRCLQAHTSQVGWEPPNVPALWAVV